MVGRPDNERLGGLLERVMASPESPRSFHPLTKQRLEVIRGYKCYDEQDELAFALELLGFSPDADLQRALWVLPFICARSEWVAH